MNQTTDNSRLVASFEDRAAQRLAAAKRLEELAQAETLGLVKEQLQKAVSNMLIQQLEFLLQADKVRKGGASC